MRSLFALVILSFATVAQAQQADPDQVGYYYPPITSQETFTRVLLKADEPADRDLRQVFLGQLRRQHSEMDGPRRFEIFAKGKDATNLIIVALDNDVFQTLFRARAVLAGLTTEARDTDFFRQNPAATRATWFDLLKLLGFEDIIITDGANWSHLVSLR